MTDPISDMLTRIRNGLAAGKSEVVIPFSTIKHRLVEILIKEKYLTSVEEVTTPWRSLMVRLKYEADDKPAIRHIKRISTPGNRFYVSKDKLPQVLSGLGIALISTSQGLMTNKEAHRKNIGGEVICEVY
ncbi:MAG: 30S ribosomal protein S8 [Patescibacteria group bacterium]